MFVSPVGEVDAACTGVSFPSAPQELLFHLAIPLGRCSRTGVYSSVLPVPHRGSFLLLKLTVILID